MSSPVLSLGFGLQGIQTWRVNQPHIMSQIPGPPTENVKNKFWNGAQKKGQESAGLVGVPGQGLAEA